MKYVKVQDSMLDRLLGVLFCALVVASLSNTQTTYRKAFETVLLSLAMNQFASSYITKKD